MKHVDVVAAVIRNGSLIFCTQRGYGDFKDYWEFPGGKVEEGETPREALSREIREELATEVSVGQFIQTIDYDYPTFHLTMRCYDCTVLRGKLELLEHEDAQWVEKADLHTIRWCPADRLLVEYLQNRIAD